MENVAEKLKEIIDSNGPDYLLEEPYKVFKTLLGEKAVDKNIAGELLYLLTTEVPSGIKPGDDLSSVRLFPLKANGMTTDSNLILFAGGSNIRHNKYVTLKRYLPYERTTGVIGTWI